MRIIYHVVPKRGGRGRIWVATCDGKEIYAADTKRQVVKWAAARGRLFRSNGTLAQVVIHGTDGQIKSERTYGRDPERSKG